MDCTGATVSRQCVACASTIGSVSGQCQREWPVRYYLSDENLKYDKFFSEKMWGRGSARKNVG
eukprot:436197-Pyramimonas_sp.AAC.1